MTQPVESHGIKYLRSCDVIEMKANSSLNKVKAKVNIISAKVLYLENPYLCGCFAISTGLPGEIGATKGSDFIPPQYALLCFQR